MLGMVALLLFWLASLVKSGGRLEAENLVLPSGEHSAAMCAAPSVAVKCGSAGVHLATLLLPDHDERRRDHQTRDGDSLASTGIQSVVPTENLILHGLGAGTSLIPLKIPCFVVSAPLIYLQISLFGYLANFSKKTNDNRVLQRSIGSRSGQIRENSLYFPW